MSGAPRADRRQPTGTRSPSPAAGPADRSGAASSPPPAGQAECRASAPSPPPARRRGTSTGHHTAARGAAPRARRPGRPRTGRPSPTPRAPASRTSRPSADPPSATARPAPDRRRRQRDLGDLVVQFDDLRLAAHAGVDSAARISARVRGTPPRGVDRAVEVPGSRSSRGSSAGSAGAGAHHRLLDTGPPAASHSREARHARRRREILPAEHRSGTAGSPGRRPRSRRDSPPLGSSHDGAHHATTCDCARVIAT